MPGGLTSTGVAGRSTPVVIVARYIMQVSSAECCSAATLFSAVERQCRPRNSIRMRQNYSYNFAGSLTTVRVAMRMSLKTILTYSAESGC